MDTNIVRKTYPSDLTGREWEIIAPFVPPPRTAHHGHPRVTDMREIVNACFYIVKTGCQWRMLPHDFPPWETVYDYFRQWKRNGTWEKLHDGPAGAFAQKPTLLNALPVGGNRKFQFDSWVFCTFPKKVE